MQGVIKFVKGWLIFSLLWGIFMCLYPGRHRAKRRA